MQEVQKIKIMQTLETTIYDEDGKYSLGCIVVPRRHMADIKESDISDKIREMDFEIVMGVMDVSPDLLPFAVSSMVVGEQSNIDPLNIYRGITKSTSLKGLKKDLGEDVFVFAEQVVSSQLIPFEQSPIALESLATLFSTSGGVGVGAYAGWVIAGGAGPMLFAWIPAGMLLFGTAAGIAMGLQSGLRDKIYNTIMGKKGNVGKKNDNRHAMWKNLFRETKGTQDSGGTQGIPSIA